MRRGRRMPHPGAWRWSPLPHLQPQWCMTKQWERQHSNKKIDKYAKQKVSGSDAGAVGGTSELESATQAATILQAISDLKVTMEGKMGSNDGSVAHQTGSP
ncbi:hypothetical protein NDU88_004616 [Pleurodeles waltl]|uniref:Uncharacterized protein n=1 Tax=Pleurodeles waltl TaxID=8319 RepID=A0AAV7VGS7_PLEWA|nr:hypothetical protein NDU88_004616 [Pleurodeles waltl]